MTASETSSSSESSSEYSSTGPNPSEWQESVTPVIPVVCPCDEKHKGKKLLDVEIPLSVEQTFQLFFTDNEWINKLEDEFKRSGTRNWHG